jgi:hypothetical protein
VRRKMEITVKQDLGRKIILQRAGWSIEGDCALLRKAAEVMEEFDPQSNGELISYVWEGLTLHRGGTAGVDPYTEVILYLVYETGPVNGKN